MNNITNKKCAFEEHKNIDAIDYCSECDIYVCEKCKDYHQYLVENNHNKNLRNKENNEINNEICYEHNHENKYEYFCKTHNTLCCIKCVTKIRGSGNGQHSQCDICFIDDIREEKKMKLKQNISYLENISTFDSLINKLKSAYAEISDKKEKLKIKIQKLFSKIRNELNKREDQLLIKVDQIYEKYFFNKNLNKEIDKIINQINISLKKGKSTLNDYNNKNINLISLINDCVMVENNIKDMDLIKENYKKYENNKKNKIDIKLKEEEINFLMNIKNFGNIFANDFIYKFENNSTEFNHKQKYIILGDKDNIVEKIIDDNRFILVKGENILETQKIHKWKISLLNTKSKLIMVGITPDEQNINPSLNNINGWYFYCFNSTLYSGKPHNYKNKIASSEKIIKDIFIIFDMNKGNLDFIMNNKKIEGYIGIPLDKPLYPSILLYDKSDKIEISEIY